MALGIPHIVCLLLSIHISRSQNSAEQAEHRDFQYNSVVDPATGRYNFAYDTGHDNEIAHSLHMQYQDADGIVRGRYGYTDPRGKLRMVEYEAGPNGFIARGDVGPDQFPHGQAPAAPVSLSENNNPRLASYDSNDFNLDPAPVQMSGWDPESDPMLNGVNGAVTGTGTGNIENENGLQTPGVDYVVNVTSNDALEMYGPELGFYSNPLSGVITLTDPSQTDTTTNAETDATPDPSQENPDLNVANIDVDPNDIRSTTDARSTPTRRSADDNNLSQTGSQPIRVPVYTRHYHPNSHDHDAEQRYYRARQTHDHDAEQRAILARRNHDHDHEAEQQAYIARLKAEQRSRQTHDHDAEQRSRYVHANHNHRPHVYRYRQGHSHDVERYHDHSGHYYPRRIFYRDSHSMVPHEHYDNPVYRSYRYARYRNNDYPAVARRGELQYIPSDKYHDKMYYWTRN